MTTCESCGCGIELQHVDYPHEPGRLYDCPACEDHCHCKAGETECVFDGEHNGLAVPGSTVLELGIMDQRLDAANREIAEHTSPPEPGTPGHEPVYGPNADGNPYAQYTPEHRVWAVAQNKGEAAASWIFDGNTDQATYQRFVKGIEDGDPEVLDSIREPSLSSEIGGDFTEDQLMAEVGWVPHDGTDMRDELATQYNDEVSDAFWHEVERLAREGAK